MLEVAIIRDEADLPEPTDHSEHEIVSIHCCDASRTLRLRLPACEMQALGQALLRMGAERPRWRDEPGDD
jgi:hypothetical protein